MPVGLYDINSASIGQAYDFIVSTVVLMFLQADRIQQLSKICRSTPQSVAITLSSVLWIRRIILARLISHSPLKERGVGRLLQGLGVGQVQ